MLGLLNNYLAYVGKKRYDRSAALHVRHDRFEIKEHVFGRWQVGVAKRYEASGTMRKWGQLRT